MHGIIDRCLRMVKQKLYPLRFCYLNIRGKLVVIDLHDFSVWLITGSNQADILIGFEAILECMLKVFCY